jgi:predicted nucleotidyltransferase
MAAFGLSDKSLETLCRILSSCHAVEKALIYGSRAKGQHKHGSDFDIPALRDHIARVGQVIYQRDLV